MSCEEPLNVISGVRWSSVAHRCWIEGRPGRYRSNESTSFLKRLTREITQYKLLTRHDVGGEPRPSDKSPEAGEWTPGPRSADGKSPEGQNRLTRAVGDPHHFGRLGVSRLLRVASGLGPPLDVVLARAPTLRSGAVEGRQRDPPRADLSPAAPARVRRRTARGPGPP
jgi:hypothetical protein